LQIRGAGEQFIDIYQHPYVSYEILPIHWNAPLRNSNLSEAWALCPTIVSDLPTNASDVHNSYLNQAPLETFEIFISYENLNQTFNSTQSAEAFFSTSRPDSDWLRLSNMSINSDNMKHSTEVSLLEEIQLTPYRLYTIKVTATKASGSYASSDLFSFMFDDTLPEVGNISDIPIFKSTEPKKNVSSAQIQLVNDDVD